MFIFPGVGLAAVAAQVEHINDRMFYQSALALAQFVSDDHLAQGRVCVEVWGPLSENAGVPVHP
jgi:malic enzyme